jgi:radical SAM superfamily enzyme YgiQ (UPF0313 family)
MKILLVQPPSRKMLSTNVPKFVDEHTGHYPPLGLLYIAAALERAGDSEVRFLDASAAGFGQEEIEREIAAFAPDVVGVQMMTFTSVDAYQTVVTAKKVDPNIFVVVGGPHPNIFPRETLMKPEIDCVVLGEGERTMPALVKRLASGSRNLSGLAHVAWRGPNGYECGTPDKIEDLDSLPFPARHLLDLDRYYTIIGKYKRMTTLVSSRGCPYRCLFCDRAYWGKLYRKRSPANVADEIEACMKLGIEEFDFQDDTFTIDRNRAMAICDEILARGLKIHWDVRARINTMDEELMIRLKEAGVYRIHYGIEAGTPEIIKVLRKEIDLEEAVRIFRMTRRHGIESLAYFIIGSPSETRGHILRTIDYIKRLDPDYLHIGILTPFPSTDLYSQGLESGFIPSDYWREFAEHLDPSFIPPFWEEHLRREELIELLATAFRSFYSRPKFIMRQLLRVRSPKEFYRKARAGLSMFRYWMGARPSEPEK